MNKLSNEPVITGGAIVALIESIILLLTSFGLKMSADQVTAIMSVVVILVPIIMAVWARSQVTPVSNPRDNEGRQLVAVDPS